MIAGAKPLPTLAPAPVNTPTATLTPTQLPSATPTATPTPSPSPTVTPTDAIYVVQAGDTFNEIAAFLGVSPAELQDANPDTSPSRIHPGHPLKIPETATYPTGMKVKPTVSAPKAPAAAAGKKYILVDQSDQRMYVYQGDQLVFKFTISTGKNNTTLNGTFHILDKIPKAWSYPWGFWMPDWMGIYYVGYDLENGIHALPVTTSGKTLWANLLGQPSSYGCVILSASDAGQLFNWAEVGTTVEIRP